MMQDTPSAENDESLSSRSRSLGLPLLRAVQRPASLRQNVLSADDYKVSECEWKYTGAHVYACVPSVCVMCAVYVHVYCVCELIYDML